MRKRNFQEESADNLQHDLELVDAFDAEGMSVRKEEYSEIVGDEGTIFVTFDEHDDATVEEVPIFDKESFMDAWLDDVSPNDVLKAARSHKNSSATPHRELSIIEACEKLLQLLPEENVMTLNEYMKTGGSLEIDELTECATSLIDNGIYEAYDLTKPDLLDLYRSLTSEPCA
jgi:hypothetical protein